MKQCNKCGVLKPPEQFPKRGTTHRGECKACKNSKGITPEQRAVKNERAKAYKLANPEKLKDQRKAYRAKHADQIKQSSALYRLKNSDKIKARQRKYYEREKPRIVKYFSGRRHLKRSYDREYYEANKTKHAEQSKRWKKDNPDLLRVYRAVRRSAAGSAISVKLINQLKRAQQMKCRYCGADLNAGYHLDHRMPLRLGGTNEASNLQLLCPTCNMRKHAKHPELFEKEIGFTVRPS